MVHWKKTTKQEDFPVPSRTTSPRIILAALLFIGILILFPQRALAASSTLEAPEVLAPGRSFSVEYTGAVSKSWLGVYPAGGELTDPLLRIDLDGQESGTAEIAALPAGEYQLALYRFGGTPAATCSLTVTDSPVYLDRTSYEEGGRAFAAVQPGTYDDNAWIGIYAADAVPGTDPWITWTAPCDTPTDLDSPREGTPFSKLPIGEYQLILFPQGGYTPGASFPFTVVRNPRDRLTFTPSQTAVQGSMEGTLTITPGIKQPEYYWIYWADNQGILENYTEIGKIPSNGEAPLRFAMPSHITPPAEATRIVLRAGTAKSPRSSQLLAEAPIPPSCRIQQDPETSFVVLSDIHISQNSQYINNRNYARAIQDVIQNMPGIQAVVYSGDVTHNGKAKEYAVLARLLRQYGGRLPAQYLIPGNHDVALNEKDWAEQIGYFLEYTGMPGTSYRFAIGGKTALCLGSGAEVPAGDMDSVSFSAQQLEWLAAQLADAAQSDPESSIFVFLHQPLQNTLTGTEASAILENDALRAILDQYPQAVVFSGHSHAALNSEKPVYDGNGFGASMVHSGSVSALWDFSLSGTGKAKSGSQGILVEVSASCIRIRSRNFQTGKWMGDAERVLWFVH